MKKVNTFFACYRWIGIITCTLILPFIAINCGGGSGDRDATDIQGCLSDKDYNNSSYKLQKTCLYIERQDIRQTNPGTFAHAIVYADFNDDGYEDVFISSGDGSQNTTPVEMYLNDGLDTTFTLSNDIFISGTPVSIHPRKALIGDFNGDSLPDIFIIGHGYDQPPFPGEYPLLILSTPDGLQNIAGLENYVGFQHGGATADIDADQDLDIFKQNNSSCSGRSRYCCRY